MNFKPSWPRKLKLVSAEHHMVHCIKMMFPLSFALLLAVGSVSAEATSARPSNVSLAATTEPAVLPPRIDAEPSKRGAFDEISYYNYRLPKEVRPIHYDLYIHPHLSKKSFDGNVTILINVTEPTTRIVLHTKLLNISSTKLVSAENKTDVPIKSTFELQMLEYWIVGLQEEVPAGKYEISLVFESAPSDDNKGFYQVSYKPKGLKEEKWVASAKFEPTFARQAYPCFDEPTMKATYSVKIKHPNTDGYHALSNMDIEKVTDFGNYSVTTFKKSVPMSTYLVCYIVCDFEYRSILIDPKGLGEPFEMRVYAEKNLVNTTQLSLDVGKKVAEFFIQYFGIPYALPKLDMIAIPDFQPSALETWGLISYRDRLLFNDENDSSAQSRESSGAVISHELAHMWFGNLVTMSWWNDIWLNEAFASFMVYKGLNHAYPGWKVDDLFLLHELLPSLGTDSSPASHPIIQHATDPDSIFALFDSVTYQKGASVLRMLEHVVGVDNFQTAVTNYLKKYTFANAETDDFIEEVAKMAPTLDIKDLLATWTKQMGYPVVSVQKFENGDFVLTQKRFFSNPDNEKATYNNSAYNYTWTIPVTYFTNLDSSPKTLWFDRNASHLTASLPGFEWVKFNKDFLGFYRVNYPKEMWLKFADLLKQNSSPFSTLDRGNLLLDSFSLALSSQLSYDVPLEILMALENEPEQVVWALIRYELSKIQNLLEGDVMKAFKKFGAKIAKKAYEKVGWKRFTDDIEARFQVTIVEFACEMELEECVADAKDRFSAWLQNDETKPSADLRGTVFKAGLKHLGGAEEWNTVWERYLNEEEPHSKTTYRRTLSVIGNRTLLQELLSRAENETLVRKHDYLDVVRRVSVTDPDFAWDYVREKWDTFVARFGLSDPELANLLSFISVRFATEQKLTELEAFIEKYPEAGSGALARQMAVQGVKKNIKWRENNLEPIKDWLRRNNFL